MKPKRAVTELEGTVLGVLWAHEPCTPYQVRLHFTESPSPYWSGSAGAIYPLLGRLQAAGLVRSKAHATGGRKSRLFSLTSDGRAALVRWIGPPAPAEVVGVPPDPLRTRIAFMGALPAARRRKFLADIERGVLELLEKAERAYAEGKIGGPMYEPMARAALEMQRLRLKWIREMREML